MSIGDVVCTANESVLRWWFRDKLASLIVDSSLVVQMMSNDAKQTQWTIYITGQSTEICIAPRSNKLTSEALRHTPHLPSPRKRLPDGATTD